MKPRTKVQEERKWGVEFPGQRIVYAEIQRHPAMVRENQIDSHFPLYNATAKSTQTWWRHKGTGAPPPDGRRQRTTEVKSPLPGTPPVPPSLTEGSQGSQIEGAPTRYVYIHTPLPNTQFFNLNAYVKDSKHNKDIISDLLTDEGTSTG